MVMLEELRASGTGCLFYLHGDHYRVTHRLSDVEVYIMGFD